MGPDLQRILERRHHGEPREIGASQVGSDIASLFNGNDTGIIGIEEEDGFILCIYPAFPIASFKAAALVFTTQGLKVDVLGPDGINSYRAIAKAPERRIEAGEPFYKSKNSNPWFAALNVTTGTFAYAYQGDIKFATIGIGYIEGLVRFYNIPLL